MSEFWRKVASAPSAGPLTEEEFFKALEHMRRSPELRPVMLPPKPKK